MYQIFISYRREGGEFLGKMIYDRLSQKGYRVFYDVETLTSGHFNTQLYHVIEECQDFLLLLTPGSMDRCCRDSDDWVRSEIRHALKCGKNIIPIMARGFSWPPVLPEELRSLPIYEAVTANNEYFDAAIDRLCSKFLKSIPDSTQNRTRQQSKYPATCSAVITPTVREFLDYKVKYGIPAEKLKQLFLDLFTMSAADAAKKISGSQKTSHSLHPVGSEMLEQALLNIISCFDRLEPDKKDELKIFFDRIRQRNQIYESDGTPLRKQIGQIFSLQGQNWHMQDVFQLGDRKYGMAVRYDNNLIPEADFFHISENDDLLQLQKDSPQYLMAAVYYAQECLLMDIIPPSYLSAAGPAIYKMMSEKESTRSMAEHLKRMEGFHNTEIYGTCEKKQIFGKKQYTLHISRKEITERDLQSHLRKKISSLSSMIPLDLVSINGYDEFLLLACPRDPSGKHLALDRPVIYKIEKSYAGASVNPVLNICEITEKKGLPLTSSERFALQMLLARLNDVVI